MSRFIAFLLPLLLLLPGGAVLAQATPETTPAAAGTRWESPDSRFSLPIPTGWTSQTRDGVGILTSPEGDLVVYALDLPETNPAKAVVAGWRQVDPGFAKAAIDVVEPPSEPGIDRTVVVTYDLGQRSGQVEQAVAHVVGDTTYLMLFQGSLEATMRRAAQLQIIATGLEIAGSPQIDLRGATPRTLDAATLDAFAAYIDDLRVRLDVPGASVAVVQNGAVVFERGFGVRELGSGDPVTPSTRMMIGSVTKSMTTMMMATLVDDGKMRWDESAVDILPSFAVADPAITPQVTVQDLVCACTGVPRRDLELIFNAETLTPRDVIRSLASFQFFTPIGEAFQYSNQMVAVGGYIAALAAGGAPDTLEPDYARAMRQRVFDPIGMTRTTLSFAEVAADPDHATPHGQWLDGSLESLPMSAERFALAVAPAGAVWSDAGDMAAYLLTELGRGIAPNGARVVSAANLEHTWQPQVAISADESYGLGWIVSDYKGVRLIEHDGATLGFSAKAAFLADAGLGVVVLSNAAGASLFSEGVTQRLFELAYDQPVEFDATIAFAERQLAEARAKLAATPTAWLDPAAVESFVGTYRNDALGEIAIRLKQGTLILDAGEFSAELRPSPTPDAQPGDYIAVSPPLTGLRVTLEERGGGPVVVVHDTASADTYAFAPAPIDGPPEATPEAA
ncbi:MAG: serine hydrolase [Thermomicrobiales bacterium]|nr:serine hydrolase [Thermomicrobiales bacterium]